MRVRSGQHQLHIKRQPAVYDGLFESEGTEYEPWDGPGGVGACLCVRCVGSFPHRLDDPAQVAILRRHLRGRVDDFDGWLERLKERVGAL